MAGRLLAAARRLGIEAREEAGPRLAEAAREAAERGSAALGVAGGDGSVAAVAGVAVEYDLPLVVVPTGTLNHFASDVGLSVAQPLAALEAFDGRELRSMSAVPTDGSSSITSRSGSTPRRSATLTTVGTS